MKLIDVKKLFEETTGLGFPEEDSYAMMTQNQINQLVHAAVRHTIANIYEDQIEMRNQYK